MSTTSLRRRVTAEFLGTAFLVATVIGSGIMAERLAGGNVALALLANTVATGAILVALILSFGGISGAHFNPTVTVADALEHGMPWREVPAYIAVQCCGGLVGTIVAHLMFGLPLFSLSRHARSGGAQVFSEFVATFGLLAVIWGCSRVRANSVPFAVWLIPSLPETAEDILLPHESGNQMKTYLFACVHNAGRSQIAAALFNLYADRSGCLAISAGTQPADHIHPEVVEIMREIGVDLSSARPRRLTEDLARTASVLVTMGCGEACQFVPNLRTIDWALPDPKGQSLDAVRTIRDEIHDRVKELIRSECAECCNVV
jgi:protein-tyrosine-phosphatase